MYNWKVIVFHNGTLITNSVMAESAIDAVAEVMEAGWPVNQIFSVIPENTEEVYNAMVEALD